MLVHCTLLICCTIEFEQELEFIKKIFCNNVYLLEVGQYSINAQITSLQSINYFNGDLRAEETDFNASSLRRPSPLQAIVRQLNLRNTVWIAFGPCTWPSRFEIQSCPCPILDVAQCYRNQLPAIHPQIERSVEEIYLYFPMDMST